MPELLERFPRHAMLHHAEQAKRQGSNCTNAASTSGGLVQAVPE
jgi:hypothetical protein